MNHFQWLVFDVFPQGTTREQSSFNTHISHHNHASFRIHVIFAYGNLVQARAKYEMRNG